MALFFLLNHKPQRAWFNERCFVAFQGVIEPLGLLRVRAIGSVFMGDGDDEVAFGGEKFPGFDWFVRVEASV